MNFELFRIHIMSLIIIIIRSNLLSKLLLSVIILCMYVYFGKNSFVLSGECAAGV